MDWQGRARCFLIGPAVGGPGDKFSSCSPLSTKETFRGIGASFSCRAFPSPCLGVPCPCTFVGSRAGCRPRSTVILEKLPSGLAARGFSWPAPWTSLHPDPGGFSCLKHVLLSHPAPLETPFHFVWRLCSFQCISSLSCVLRLACRPCCAVQTWCGRRAGPGAGKSQARPMDGRRVKATGNHRLNKHRDRCFTPSSEGLPSDRWQTGSFVP